MDIDTVFREAIVVTVQFQNDVKATIALIYRSPNSSKDNSENLNSLINCLSTSNHSNLIILGDFNFKRIEWMEMNTGVNNSNSEEDRFLNCVMDNYMCQHVVSPTRYREGQESSILDLILTKEEEIISEVIYQMPLGKSDHSVMRIETNFASKKDSKSTNKPCLNKGDYDMMRSDLSLVQWDQLFNNKSVRNC